MLSPVVRNIPSAIVLRLVKFLSRRAAQVYLKGEGGVSYFFQPPTPTQKKGILGEDEDTLLQFRFTCTD